MTAGRSNTINNQDWCTPPRYIKSIYDVLGYISLDPCSNKHSMLQAEREILLPEDGLCVEWDYPTIYVNPPYGKSSTSIWAKKCQQSWLDYCSEILLLVPVATNTAYWKECIFISSRGICFLSDTRLKFYLNGEEVIKGAPMACSMIYWGKNYKLFSSVFDEYGKCFMV